MSLALCMIVKNEADDLSRAVESVRNIVDEIVILDTGSDDDTVSIAERLGARVYAYEWQGDFAAARNESLGYVTADWALVLDADEVLSVRDHQKIQQLIDQDRIDGYYMVQRHYLRGAGYDNWTAVKGDYPEIEPGYEGYTDNMALRLFRRRPDIMYEGRVHENVISSGPAEEFVTAKTDAVIHHFGKTGDANKLEEKKKQYLELGRLKAAENPDSAKAQFELGVQLHELGQWEECVGYFSRAFELDRDHARALYYAGNTYFKLGRLGEARQALEKLVEPGSAGADALVTLAGVESREGNAEAALNRFDEAIAAQNDLFSAWFNKAALLLSLERFAEAEPCFSRALDLMPGYVHAMFGLWQCRIFLGKADVAAKEMIEWLPECPGLKDGIETAGNKFLVKGEYSRVIEALGPLAAGVDRAGVYFALGAAQLAIQKTAEAEANLLKTLELDKDNFGALVNLAQLCEVYKKENDTAISYYRDALRINPENELCRQRLNHLLSS